MYSLLLMSAAKYPNTSLTIAIPAYNEEKNLGRVVEDTLKKLPEYFEDFEVVVVDDGSSDGSAGIADRLAEKHKTVKVIHQPNGGFSRAMLAGIKAAQKKFVAYMPADGQFLIDDMRHCFEVMEANDLVLGYRGGRPDYTLRRMVMSYGYLMILVILFGIKFMDVGWVNIWRTDKVQGLKLEGTGGIFILSEIVVKFMRKGYRIVEAPSFYHVRKSGEAKNAKFSVALKTLFNALKLWYQIKTGRV